MTSNFLLWTSTWGVSGELFRLRNRSKLVERSLFAITDLLQGAKSILLYLVLQFELSQLCWTK